MWDSGQKMVSNFPSEVRKFALLFLASCASQVQEDIHGFPNMTARGYTLREVNLYAILMTHKNASQAKGKKDITQHWKKKRKVYMCSRDNNGLPSNKMSPQ